MPTYYDGGIPLLIPLLVKSANKLANPRPHERPVGREPPSQRLVDFVGAPVYQCTAPRELAPAEPSPDCRRI